MYHWINEGKQSFNLEKICFLKEFFACKSAQAISYSSGRITVFSMPCSHCKPSSHTGCSAGLLSAVWLLLFYATWCEIQHRAMVLEQVSNSSLPPNVETGEARTGYVVLLSLRKNSGEKMPLNVLAVVPGA